MCDGLSECALLSVVFVAVGTVLFLLTGIPLVLWDHLLQTDDEAWLRAGSNRKEWKVWLSFAVLLSVFGVALVVTLCYLLGPARLLRKKVPEAASIWRSARVVGAAWFVALFALSAGPILWSQFDQSLQNFPPHILMSWIGTVVYSSLVVWARARAPAEHPRGLVPIIGVGLFVVGAFWLNSTFYFCRHRPDLSAICGWTGWVWAPAIALLATTVAALLALALEKLAGVRKPVETDQS